MLSEGSGATVMEAEAALRGCHLPVGLWRPPLCDSGVTACAMVTLVIM